MKEKIEIILGDITEAETQAIVNAANSELIMGAGVAGAIRCKGGPEIQTECNKIGTIPVGEAAITGAGNLKCRHVIHAASMRLGGAATVESLSDAIKNSFLRAEENGIKSIAIPAVGAGIAGFPVRRCTEILMNQALLALRRKNIESIHFYAYDELTQKAFQEALSALAP